MNTLLPKKYQTFDGAYHRVRVLSARSKTHNFDMVEFRDGERIPDGSYSTKAEMEAGRIHWQIEQEDKSRLQIRRQLEEELDELFRGTWTYAAALARLQELER